MAKSKDHEVVSSLGQPHRVLLIELKGEQTAEDGSAAMVTTELFAALSLEEVIAVGGSNYAEVIKRSTRLFSDFYPLKAISRKNPGNFCD